MKHLFKTTPTGRNKHHKGCLIERDFTDFEETCPICKTVRGHSRISWTAMLDDHVLGRVCRNCSKVWKIIS